MFWKTKILGPSGWSVNRWAGVFLRSPSTLVYYYGRKCKQSRRGLQRSHAALLKEFLKNPSLRVCMHPQKFWQKQRICVHKGESSLLHLRLKYVPRIQLFSAVSETYIPYTIDFSNQVLNITNSTKNTEAFRHIFTHLAYF